MTSHTIPDEYLRAENAELRARLEEVEDTLRAIRSGEVDALVVETTDGPQIFTLQGLDSESNRFRGEILSQVSDSVIAVDAEDRITFFNAAAARQYSVTADAVLGRKLSEIFTRHWPSPVAEAATWNALREKGEWHGEIAQRLHDGRELHVELSLTLLRDAIGADAGMVAAIRDITERKATELALRFSEEFTRRVLDNLFSFVGVLTPDGILIEANRSPLAAGISASEVIGKPFWDAYWWSYSPEVQARVRAECESAARGETIRRDVPVRLAGGEITWIDYQLAPLRDSEGRITHLIPSAMDISDRKITTEKLRQSEEKLRDADRTKDEFLATLAHELRNPLAPIRNSLELLKSESGNAELLKQARETMERQMAHMVRLIDDLLDVSRISRDKLELKKERLELSSVIHHAVEACRPHLDRDHHEFVLNLPLEPIHLHGDPTRLAQVIGNLLTNACKYSEPGGNICLTVERQVDEVKIVIHDTGIGIPPEMLDKVFDMFTQIDKSLERSDGGLGIGLSLVKRLVELHGGTVIAESEGLGHGSEFSVRLPIEIEQPHVESIVLPPVAAPSKSAGRRILVVDDNRDSATTLALLLKMTGNETKTAFDGLAAIETAEAFLPEVILLDIGLPKMNGHETCRAIRQQPWGKDILILALTGWGQEEDRRKTAEAGFNNHLVKPVDHIALSKLISDSKQS